jgi:hypothetical protein
MGRTVEVGVSGVSGRLIAEVRAERGALHTLSAELQDGWSIDAVESSTPDAIAEWYIPRDRAPRTIELQLSSAATRTNPVTIVVTGRLQPSEPFEQLTLESLRMLKWRGLVVERSLLQLNAAEPYELDPTGDWPSLPADVLSAEAGWSSFRPGKYKSGHFRSACAPAGHLRRRHPA